MVEQDMKVEHMVQVVEVVLVDKVVMLLLLQVGSVVVG